MAAFQLAVKHGADAIELDAKLSADGIVVVMHDQSVDRTTRSSGQVRKMRLEELRKLDAGSHFDIAFKDEPVPTLAEVFEAVGKSILINVELTNYSSPADRLPEEVAKLVIQYHLEKRVLYSSFNPLALLKIRGLMPRATIGLLAMPGRKGWLARSPLGRLVPYQALHPAESDVTPVLIQRVHASGRRIHVWTVNQPEKMRQLFEWGVDGLFTDDPVTARQVLAAITH